MAISDFEELSLVGMNIDAVEWSASVLTADYGDGYGDEANVGNANGLHHWTLSAGVLPDAASYGNLISGKTRMAYYWDFFKAHTTGTRRVFLIEFRGRKYFASFVNTKMSAEVFTSDLFGAGVEIQQRRVSGYYEGTDGSVFDPSFLTSGVWAWHKSESPGADYSDGDTIIDSWDNLIVGNPELGAGGATVNTYETNEIQGRPCIRLNGTDSYFTYGTVTKTIYEALFLFKCRDAVWANFSGILTGYNTTATNAAFVSGNGNTKLQSFSFGSSYSYWKDGVLLTEATQNTPMQVYGVIHGRWENGVSLVRPQIGWDRDIASRFAKIDIAEIILCDALPSTEVSSDLDGYLNFRRLNP